MLKNIDRFSSRIILILVMICSIQGHRPEQSSQSTIQHVAPSARGRTDAHNDGKSRVSAGRASPADDYNIDRKNPVDYDSHEFDSDAKIIFPTGSSRYTTHQPKLEHFVAASCENSTFCENPPFYPDDFIKKAIKDRDDLKYLAVIDPAPDIDQRIDAGEPNLLCKIENQVVFPRSAENTAKEWLYIVNDDTFPQGVMIEICSGENSTCGVIDSILPGYETSCKQKYVYRKMAAVNSKGAVDTDYFRFPVSCCCHVTLAAG